ncbi:recombinase family protein [Streptomyces sp. 6N106]|uniref:recombinase family protein n=1 Tax=Streptomyces sp. 6N106 TaxID=3457418 RepID=UPI003FD115A8
MRLAGHIRVSTGSRLDGFGLEDQERIVCRWTREHGHRLVKLFVEKAQSGTIAGDERPELATTLLRAEEKKAQGIIAPNLDRLVRELVVQETALAQCRTHGGRAGMADQGENLPDDPEDPMRTVMRQMMGVFAQLGRGMTVAKLRRGRRRGGAGAGRPSPSPPATGRGPDVLPRDRDRPGIRRAQAEARRAPAPRGRTSDALEHQQPPVYIVGNGRRSQLSPDRWSSLETCVASREPRTVVATVM